MKVNIITKQDIKEKVINPDDSIKELYDILDNPNDDAIYFRDTLLNPKYKVRYYFPYFIPKIYLYTKPILNLKNNDIVESFESDRRLRNVLYYIYGYLLLLIILKLIL